MKKMKFFAMAFAALAIASCSKEQSSQDVVPPVVEGIETYATFNFTVEGSDSKSKADVGSGTDGTDEGGDDIKDIRVVIFNAEGILEDASEPTTGATSVPMKVTSGVKRIFVFANSKNTVNFPTLTKGTTTLESCYKYVMSMVKNNLGADQPFSVSDLVGSTKGYYMSNIRAKSSLCTLYPNITAEESKSGGVSKNQLSFEVSRAVSKVNAKLKDADVLNVMSDTTQIATLKDLKYTVRNINKGVTPVQIFTNDLIEDANLETGTPMAAYFNQFISSDMTLKATFAPYYDSSFGIDQDLLAYTLPETGPKNSIYVTENTNAKQVVGNTSYLAIKATYTPTNVVTKCTYESVGGGSFAITEEAPTEGVTFYRINLTGLINIGGATLLKNNLFSDKAIAEATLKAVLLNGNGYVEGGTPEQTTALNKAIADRLFTYTDGLAYYRLNIGRTDAASKVTTYGIRRNARYAITINSISKLGSNTEDGLTEKPETPVTSQETYVTATITVKGWQDYQQGGDL